MNKHYINELYKYPNSRRLFRLIKVENDIYYFNGGHCCTCCVFVDLIRVKTGIQVFKDNQIDLFNIEALKPSNYCRSCKHRQRWEAGNKTIQYCGLIKSNKTLNGLKKIKASLPACGFYEENL